MSKKLKSEEHKTQNLTRPGKPISFESAIFLFALLSASSDRDVIERGLRLALRSPDLLGAFLWNIAASQGIDLHPLMGGEDAAPATRAEVKEFAEPLLKKGAGMVTIAQIADIFLFRSERTPENIVYAFYTGIRYARAGEREPTKEESGRIWEDALLIAQNSKIGEMHWKELMEQDPQRLKDWIEARKEDARKRYKTFLSQKRRAEATAQRALESLMSDMFGEEDETS